jgi:small subunit ribosomal protein S16
MLKIRLARGGRKAVPFYRIVATNSTSPRDSKFLEKLGTYNPLANDSDEKKLVIDKERVEYWLSVGAKPSERVALFLIKLGCKGADKYKPSFTSRKKGEGAKKKALEKMKAAQEAAEAAAAEVATPKEEAPQAA